MNDLRICHRLLPAILCLLMTGALWAHPLASAAADDTVMGHGAESLAIATWVSTHEQARAVAALIKSIRDHGGKYAGSRICVVLGDPAHFPCTDLRTDGVVLLPVEMDEAFRSYPLAIKAFAAAQVEQAVRDKVSRVAWFDPGVIVLAEPAALALDAAADVAVRSVSLSNGISLPPGTAPNAYWAPIYEATGLDYRTLPTRQTVVDQVAMQPYYNCEVFAFNPRLGIAAEWARLLTERLQDEDYQRTACASFRQQLFLHQAVLSAVISARVKPERIRPLPLTHGYPFTQHEQLDPGLQVSSFNDLTAVIFDYAWDKIPTWADKLTADEALRQWLFDTYLAYLKLDDNLYRMEGSCNAYLVTTPAGSVLIDPAGANAAPQYFRKVLAQCPLKAILLTHAHQDHWDHLDQWRAGADIPVIAQREFNTYNEYRKRLAPFYDRRAAIWARRPLPAPEEVEPLHAPLPTVTFADEYTFALGGIHFKMVHTPGETPDHTTIWIPELRAVFVGDNYYEYFINNATLRGTNTRPVLGYIAALDLALSYKPAWFLMGHGSPVVTPDLVQRTVTDFRDALQYVHDETIRGINAGQDVHTLMREIRLPDRFNVRPYFGQVHWTVRGIYHENIGWFEENPADMYDVPPSSVYPDLVDLAGADAILGRTRALVGAREYVRALRLTEVVLQADPRNKAAHELRLAALEGLKAGTANYIERIWLDYGIRLAKESLGQ